MTNQIVNPAVGGTGGQTRRFAYNYRGQMTALHDKDGRVFAYEFDGDPAGGGAGGQPRFRHVFHADALGSIVALTDESGTTTKTYAYEAFGRIRVETGDAPLNRITYTGREALGSS